MPITMHGSCSAWQPGIWVQHLTVFEPDDSMIEVAIAAITPVLPENPEEGKW